MSAPPPTDFPNADLDETTVAALADLDSLLEGMNLNAFTSASASTDASPALGDFDDMTSQLDNLTADLDFFSNTSTVSGTVSTSGTGADAGFGLSWNSGPEEVDVMAFIPEDDIPQVELETAQEVAEDIMGVLKVELPNKSHFKFVFTSKTTTVQMVDQVCRKAGIAQSRFFGLQRLRFQRTLTDEDVNCPMVWLSSSRPIAAQELDLESIVYLRMRAWPVHMDEFYDQSSLEMAIHEIDSRLAMKNPMFKPPLRAYLELAGCRLQMRHGDFKEGVSFVSDMSMVRSLVPEYILPQLLPHATTDEEIVEQLAAALLEPHRALAGLDKIQSHRQFLKIALSYIPFISAHFFSGHNYTGVPQATNRNAMLMHVPVVLSVSPHGVAVWMNNKGRLVLQAFYRQQDIIRSRIVTNLYYHDGIDPGYIRQGSMALLEADPYAAGPFRHIVRLYLRNRSANVACIGSASFVAGDTSLGDLIAEYTDAWTRARALEDLDLDLQPLDDFDPFGASGSSSGADGAETKKPSSAKTDIVVTAASYDAELSTRMDLPASATASSLQSEFTAPPGMGASATPTGMTGRTLRDMVASLLNIGCATAGSTGSDDDEEHDHNDEAEIDPRIVDLFDLAVWYDGVDQWIDRDRPLSAQRDVIPSSESRIRFMLKAPFSRLLEPCVAPNAALDTNKEAGRSRGWSAFKSSKKVQTINDQVTVLARDPVALRLAYNQLQDLVFRGEIVVADAGVATELAALELYLRTGPPSKKVSRSIADKIAEYIPENLLSQRKPSDWEKRVHAVHDKFKKIEGANTPAECEAWIRSKFLRLVAALPDASGDNLPLLVSFPRSPPSFIVLTADGFSHFSMEKNEPTKVAHYVFGKSLFGISVNAPGLMTLTLDKSVAQASFRLPKPKTKEAEAEPNINAQIVTASLAPEIAEAMNEHLIKFAASGVAVAAAQDVDPTATGDESD
ncbi:hypothetical protein H696_06242 [Fonticula alba]|uniref:FERM domain-containing protein n=1 Tax=Fonticula alba TaxID=691883 RepID=A0A058Z064_FONAL|nr:hypothetical protein H696_06242 [Fonticula alba]KCV67333.1 hypothetical protein H696_06242 [Fonticula alba]|eukprot:XP_009498265.1 hypothetical protein H696_06242 [Fonticula alba]